MSEDTTATFAGFRVDEVLTSIGATTAVGRTPAVTGVIEIDGTSLVGVDVTADLTGIKSDQSRREGAIQRALNTSDHPQATFSLTEPIELGSGASEGEIVEATAVGDLTINGITKSIELPVRAQLIDDTILVTAATDLTFSEFDVTAPSAASVVSVEDVGVLELQLWLSR
ncbi:MAG: YceI family protein [Acidimicrobiia bacterium]|nr:YceI family protein [Acidimicrobiia bacterium]